MPVLTTSAVYALVLGHEAPGLLHQVHMHMETSGNSMLDALPEE